MTRARAVVLALIFGCLCIVAVNRLAEGQVMYPGQPQAAGLPTITVSGGATGAGSGGTVPVTLNLGDGASLDGQLPVGFQQAQTMGGCAAGTTGNVTGYNLTDAACATGPVPVALGGFGNTSPQQGITWGNTAATGPCSDPNVIAYGNGDNLVVAGDSGAVTTWTDLCGGYVFSQAVNANMPAIQTGAINGHTCIRWTVGTAQALANTTLPAVAAPFSFGALTLFARSAPGQFSYYMSFPANAAGTAGNGENISLYHSTSNGDYCKAGIAVLEPAAIYSNGYFPQLDMCIVATAGDAGSMLTHVFEQGGALQAGNNSPPTVFGTDGGLTLGASVQGGAVNSADGEICDWFVFKTAATLFEQKALASYIHTRLGI